MSTATVDSLTSEQFRAAFEGPDAPKRDEKGRFLPAGGPNAAAVANSDTEDVKTVPIRREIDLGDGSGKQVFEASTTDELLDKLTTAQLHATRKIRQQNQALKELRGQSGAPKYAPKAMTPDEEFVVGQEFSTKPRDAFRKLFEAETGMSLDQFRNKAAAIDAIEEQRQANAIGEQYCSEHPEYHACPQNASAINRYFKTYNLAATMDNLEQAIDELSTSGLLVTETPAAEAEAIPQVVAPPKRKATGLFGVGAAPSGLSSQPAKKLSDADLSKMSSKQLAEWMEANQA